MSSRMKDSISGQDARFFSTHFSKHQCIKNYHFKKFTFGVPYITSFQEGNDREDVHEGVLHFFKDFSKYFVYDETHTPGQPIR